jgi:flagellar basal-body rod modification protein FlgD
MPDPITTGLVSELTTQQKQAALPDKGNELGQEVFLELMVAQMQNQDPLSPQENSEFVAQLAQFSSVEGLDKLNDTMDNFVGSFQSGQALQASSMVGRVVKVDSETSYLPTDGAIAGTIELPQSTNNLSLKIYDSSGQLVADQMLGEAAAGDIVFVWDGTDVDGNQAAAGVYRFEAVANLDGRSVQVNTALSANVDSVTVGANSTISLNVAGVGPVSMSGVKEIL